MVVVQGGSTTIEETSEFREGEWCRGEEAYSGKMSFQALKGRQMRLWTLIPGFGAAKS